MDRSPQYKIAIASTDGAVVNTHFGRADSFYIYDIYDDGSYYESEIRLVNPVCEGGGHNEARMSENAKKFADCRYVIASRIGQGAQSMLSAYGTEGFELPGDIDKAIEGLIRYEQVQRLFD